MNKTQILLGFLLIVQALSQATQVIPHFDHIIVGAGIAGIGASQILTNNNAQHLMIEARDRIGGRLSTFQFMGTSQDEGASFVHYPYDNEIEVNRLHTFIQAKNIDTIDANFSKQAVYYAINRSQFSKADLDQAATIHQQLANYIWNQGDYYMDYDAPVSTLLQKFWKNRSNPPAHIKDRVNAEMYEDAIDNGADLTTMSSWEWDGENDGSDKWDYAPTIGMGGLARRIFNEKCSPVLHLSEVVRKVDYSGPEIVVTTNKGSYSTLNLFVGVTLGNLKAGTIEFVPELPSAKKNAINSIGFGTFEKLYVQFDQPFWPSGKRTLAFVGQGSNSKYSEAWIIPGPENFVIFFLGGSRAQELASWTNEQIKADLQNELSKYVSQPFVVKNVHYTRWESDPYTLGGYSYAKVNTATRHFNNLRSVLQSGNKKIWFIGEATNPDNYSYAHGAYNSGIRAANQAV